MQRWRKLLSKLICLPLLFLFGTAAVADNNIPLPIDNAFAVSAKLFGSDTIVVSWNIAPDHYLYKERFSFKIIKPDTASLGTIILPNGQHHENEIFGKYESYSHTVTIPVPIISPNPQETILLVNYQGCSENGYCYPPVAKNLTVNFTAGTIKISDVAQTDSISAKPTVANNNQEESYISLLSGHHIISILFAFFGFGVLLSFTPCVLPMLPILSGIILGHKEKITTPRAFRLSLVYVLSMACTYAIAGVLVGFIGGSVQTLFQKPWLLIIFSLIFVLLALSFFGFYQLKLPTKFEERLAELSRKQKGGRYVGVAIMGCLATLIVSPCVTPALVGVLGYIGQTGDAILGGSALFSMGLGMGLPLIIMGTAGGKLLPKAGHWMQTLESCFGVLFLGMAIWMLDRILPNIVTMILWSALFIISAVYMGALSGTPTSGWGKLWKGTGLIFLVYGILLLIGVAQGGTNIFQPLTNIANYSAETPKTFFTRVNNLAELEQTLVQANTENKPVMLDFYADWCISCKEMEYSTFRDPALANTLSNFVVLQADVTKNSAQDKALMQAFGVIAPPTLLFFDAQGKLLKDLTLVGKISASDLIKHIQAIP